MSDQVSIKGLKKAQVLAVLFNGARTQGLGFLHHTEEPMTEQQAQKILNGGQTYFDYFEGRVMKVDISGEEFDPWSYDRDNGQGAAGRIISELRRTEDVNPEEAEITRLEGTRNAAMLLKEHLRDESVWIHGPGEIPALLLTAEPHADELEPILDEVLDGKQIKEHLRDESVWIHGPGEIPALLLTAEPHADELEPILDEVLDGKQNNTDNDAVVINTRQILVLIFVLLAFVGLIAWLGSLLGS